jgi:cytochrome c-type biogenesis protein
MHSLSELIEAFLSPSSFGLINLLAAIGVAYLGGILSSLTPCIYPMIPITIGVIGGIDSTSRSWKSLVLKTFSYVLGMTAVYSFLGVGAGLTGKVFGSFTNTTVWYFGLGLFMNLAALVMLDVIPLDLSALFSKLTNAGNSNKNQATPDQSTFAAALLMGATSGTIAAPCTTPVLAAILGYIAHTKSIGVGLALMLAFSLGLSTILLVIAFFAGSIRRLPRAGSWLKPVKIMSGLLLLAFAEYLIFKAGKMGGV